MHPELLKLLGRFALASTLADKAMADAPAESKGKAAAVQEAAVAATKSIEDLMAAFKGGDVDAVFAALEATKAVIDTFENAVNAMTGAPPDADAAPDAAKTSPAPAVEDPETKSVRISLASLTGEKNMATALRAVESWKALAVEHERETAKLAAERKALDATERKTLVGKLVTAGRITPAVAWADAAATTPAEPYSSMTMELLRKHVAELVGAPNPIGGAPVAPRTGDTHMPDQVAISEGEIRKCRESAERNGVKPDATIAKYRAIKLRQGLREEGARRDEYLRAVDPKHIIQLSTGVTPISEFGATSQIALINWRLEYNTALASQPKVWAETLGDVLPGNSLKDDYPIALDALKYTEKKAQSAPAMTTLAKDIAVTKREWTVSAQALLRRILMGDFAYIQSWQRKAEQMARARTFLRNNVTADLFATGLTSGTCSLDGLAFFSASHKVNPFDATIKTKNGSSATWSNYESAATPLNAANLTAQKTKFKQTPGPDGQELGLEATHVLVPTSLDETGYNLLSVQDVILDAAATLNTVSNAFGAVKNPHYNSGMKKVRAPELPGTDTTADWYLLSETAFQMGLFPWVIAENSAEELTVWDETSDFYKDSKHIKVESSVLLEVAFLFPHGIRMIKGS